MITMCKSCGGLNKLPTDKLNLSFLDKFTPYSCPEFKFPGSFVSIRSAFTPVLFSEKPTFTGSNFGEPVLNLSGRLFCASKRSASVGTEPLWRNGPVTQTPLSGLARYWAVSKLSKHFASALEKPAPFLAISYYEYIFTNLINKYYTYLSQN